MSDETTLLREKLNKLIIEIERLDIKLDSPAYDMTLGEYEQEREKLLDEFEQTIAATLGEYSYDWQAIADELNARAERTCHDASVDSSTQFYCSECECTVDVPLLWGEINYCPNCGAKVVDA